MNGGHLNQFAISAQLGTVLGPTLNPAHGAIASTRLAQDLLDLLRSDREWRDSHRSPLPQEHLYYRLLVRAFQETRDGYSPDRVIADPQLDEAFIAACRRLGLHETAYQLNKALLRLRKSSALASLRSARRTIIPNQWQFAPASEFAARALYYRSHVSVDSLLCHPGLAQQFDSLCSKLVPGFTPLEYRWAALNIRKRGAKAVEDDTIADFLWEADVEMSNSGFSDFDAQGIYAIRERATYLYIAETKNLRHSHQLHLDLLRSDGIDRTLWDPDLSAISWFSTPTPSLTAQQMGRTVTQLVGSLFPVFNIPRTAA